MRLLGLLWWYRVHTLSVLVKLAATGLSYLGGPWTMLFVGILLFSDTMHHLLMGQPITHEPFEKREDEGR